MFPGELENDKRISSIKQVIDRNKNSKEYFCTFNEEFDDGWITILDDSNPKVLEYIKAKDADIMVYEAEKRDWMQPIWTTL